jgi:hypothetical protein
MMEEEEKVLFSVISQMNGTSVKCEASGPKELFQVALAIISLKSAAPALVEMIDILEQMYEDSDFKQTLEEATVEIPDFNKLLRN